MSTDLSSVYLILISIGLCWVCGLLAKVAVESGGDHDFYPALGGFSLCELNVSKNFLGD